MTTAEITIPTNHPNIFTLPFGHLAPGIFSNIPATKETANRGVECLLEVIPYVAIISRAVLLRRSRASANRLRQLAKARLPSASCRRFRQRFLGLVFVAS